MLRRPFIRTHEHVGAQSVPIVVPVGAAARPVKRLAFGGRRSRAERGGFVPTQIESSMTASAGCTVVIDAQLRLECATLPGVDWLSRCLSTALTERRRGFIRCTRSERCIRTLPRSTFADPSAGV